MVEAMTAALLDAIGAAAPCTVPGKGAAAAVAAATSDDARGPVSPPSHAKPSCESMAAAAAGTVHGAVWAVGAGHAQWV